MSGARESTQRSACRAMLREGRHKSHAFLVSHITECVLILIRISVRDGDCGCRCRIKELSSGQPVYIPAFRGQSAHFVTLRGLADGGSSEESPGQGKTEPISRLCGRSGGGESAAGCLDCVVTWRKAEWGSDGRHCLMWSWLSSLSYDAD